MDDKSGPAYVEAEELSDLEAEIARNAQVGHVSEATAVQGIMGAAMVSILGGGPRLAIRAARIVLEDSHNARSSARQGQSRLRRLTRRRGD
jgi:hypothetical protein